MAIETNFRAAVTVATKTNANTITVTNTTTTTHYHHPPPTTIAGLGALFGLLRRPRVFVRCRAMGTRRSIVSRAWEMR